VFNQSVYWGAAGQGRAGARRFASAGDAAALRSSGSGYCAGRRPSCAASVEVLCLDFLRVNRRILWSRQCRGCAWAALCKRATCAIYSAEFLDEESSSFSALDVLGSMVAYGLLERTTHGLWKSHHGPMRASES